jgi:hypothetical protein
MIEIIQTRMDWDLKGDEQATASARALLTNEATPAVAVQAQNESAKRHQK